VPENCAGEQACVESCPTAAISFQPAGEDRHTWRLDYGLCVFCGNCLAACPNDAIIATEEFELAGRNRTDVVVVHSVRSVTRD
jgi:NAD(P)H-quinone oxidoreductase subunit I